MADNNIENSIVAQGGSSISGVSSAIAQSGSTVTSGDIKISMKKVKAKAGIFGFVLGIISSVIASYVYSFMNS